MGGPRIGPPTLRNATRRFLALMGPRTPDGARYTFKAVQNALEGLE